MESPDEYFDAFTHYLQSGDATRLLPYLQSGADPAYLRIYRNGAIKSGLNALASNFPTVKQLLGDNVFNSLARNYVLHHWPSDSCLSSYGDGFPDILSNQPRSIPGSSVDFARLDRAWLDALLAQDEEPLSGDELVKIIQGEQEKQPEIKVVSSVRIVHLKSPCLPQWIELKFDVEAELQALESNSVILWRQEELVYYRQLSKFEEAFIRGVAESASIMKAAEKALSIEPTGDISSLFSQIITAGILTKHQ